MKYWADTEPFETQTSLLPMKWRFIWIHYSLSWKTFSSPSKGCTMPDVASPKLKRLIRCEIFSGTSSNRFVMWICPLAKWMLLPAVMWKFPATLFSVNEPWTRHASVGLLGFTVRSGRLYAVLWPPLCSISLKIKFCNVERFEINEVGMRKRVEFKYCYWFAYVQRMIFLSQIRVQMLRILEVGLLLRVQLPPSILCKKCSLVDSFIISID